MPENEYEGFDTAAAAADIGAELFPSEGETVSEEVVEPPVKTESALPPEASSSPTANPQPAVDPAAPAVVPGQNSQIPALPKSWKKEMSPVWEKMPQESRAYVLERESQIMRGINQYAGAANNWGKLIQPFEPMLQQYPDVNPVELMQGLTATHLHLLSPATPMAEKVRVVQALLHEYGINLAGEQVPQPDAMLLARLEKAEKALATVQQSTTHFQRQAYQAGVDQQLALVNAFAADPKNKHYPEVENDIFRLIKTGAAADLPSAYEMAIWSNPTVRAKVLAEQQTTALPANKPRAQNGQFVNLDADSGKAKTKPISIDNTVDEIVAKHYSTQAH